MTAPASSSPNAADLRPPRAPGYAALDAWRGIAALLVVLYHATATYRGDAHPASGSSAHMAVRLFDEFWLGVQLFFVISGYCIAATADAARRKPAAVSTFAWRRFVRVFPTFAAWLVLVTLALAAAEYVAPQASFWSRKSRFVPLSQMHWGEWLSNLTLTHTWLPQLVGLRPISITEVSWTLCYEIQFYFVCGTLLALFPRKFFAAAAGLTAALAALFVANSATSTGVQWRGTFLDGRWLQFAMGLGLYYVLNYQPPITRRAYSAGMLAVAIGCWFLRDGAPDGAVVFRKYLLEFTCCGLFTALLVSLKSYDSLFRDARWLAPLMKCGLISYSLYLVHWPFCKIASMALWGLGFRSLPATLLVTVPVSTAASLAAAAAFYLAVERRFLNTRAQPVAAPLAPLPQFVLPAPDVHPEHAS